MNESVESAASPRAELTLSPRRIVAVLAAGIGALLVLALAGQYLKHVTGHDYVYGLLPKFDLDGEANVPAFFSSLLLLSAAVLLAMIASAKAKTADAWNWRGLALIFFALAMDEVAGFHELLTEPMRSLLGAGGYAFFAWVVPGALFVLLFLASYARFIFRLPPATRTLFVCAGLVYVSGTIGMEMVAGRYFETAGRSDATFGLMCVAEEMLEMCGVLLFIHGLLRYMKQNVSEIRLRVE